MKQFTKPTNMTRLSAPSLLASRVVTARHSIPDESWAPNQRVPGTIYRIIRPLGSGGMGDVFEVEDETIGRRLALKAIRRTLCVREDLAQRFGLEAQVLGQLHEHPNLVDVITAGRADDGRVYLVMELLKGCSLDCELAQQHETPVPLATLLPWACGVMRQVLEALRAAHAKGFLHRDVKPANVFLQAKGSVKLLDFGIAGLFEPTPGSSLTQPGQLPGTPGYMPPERLRGGTADERTDVFAAGVLLWEMLARDRAVPDLDPTRAAVRVIEQGIPSLGSRLELAALPRALVEVVDRATASAWAERFVSIEAFAEALRAATAKLGEPAHLGPLVGHLRAPVPFAPAPLSPSATDTREVSFETDTTPNARATGERWGEGPLSSAVDPFAGTRPIGFVSPAVAADEAAPRRRWAREAPSPARPGSREHDTTYRDSPTITASLRGAAALIAAAVGRARVGEQAPASPQVPSRPPIRLQTIAVGFALVGLGMTLAIVVPPSELLALVAPPSAGSAAPGDAAIAPAGERAAQEPRAREAAERGQTAAPAEASVAVVAPPEAAESATAAAAAAAVAPATAAAAVAPATAAAAAAVAPAAAAVAPAAALAAATAAPAGLEAKKEDTSAVALKGAGLSAPAAGTAKPVSAKAASAAPRGAAVAEPRATPGPTGARTVRDEGAAKPAPAPKVWRLKRVLKIEL